MQESDVENVIVNIEIYTERLNLVLKYIDITKITFQETKVYKEFVQEMLYNIKTELSNAKIYINHINL